MSKILIIEDEESIANLEKDSLRMKSPLPISRKTIWRFQDLK